MLGQCVIGSLDEHDLDQIMSIEQACYASPWTMTQFRDELTNPVACVAGCKTDGQLVGYICFWLIADEMQILNVAVSPEDRGRGIGKRLLDYAVQECRKKALSSAWLEVRRGNQAAVTLYRNYGFRVDGVRQGYYQDGEDALLMVMMFDQKQDDEV